MGMYNMRTFEEGDYITGFDFDYENYRKRGIIRYVCKSFYHIDRDDKVGGSGIWYNGNKLWTVSKTDDELRLVMPEEAEEKVLIDTTAFNRHFDKIAMDALDSYGKKGPAKQKKPATTLPTDSAGRKEVPLYRGLVQYFPAALAGVAKVSKRGNDKHQAGKPLQHSRNKSGDHPDCILRHLIDLSEDYGCGVGRDEKGVAQVDYIAWRALALAQEWHEKNDGSPLAPGASKGGSL